MTTRPRRQWAPYLVSLCALIASNSTEPTAQARPLKVDVAVVVRNPAVAVPGGFTVFQGAKGVETPDFDFEQTLETEWLAALAGDARVACQAVSGVPDRPAATSDRLLVVDVEIIQAIKKIMEPTHFTMSGTISMIDATGTRTWTDRYAETVKVKGKMDEFVQDGQKGLKTALDRLITHFVEKRAEKFRNRKSL